MIFHASSVKHLEMRDTAGNALPDDAPLYKNAEIAFVMESGRVNSRKVSRLTAKQYARVKEALEAEKKYKDVQ
jgi:ribosomal protein S18